MQKLSLLFLSLILMNANLFAKELRYDELEEIIRTKNKKVLGTKLELYGAEKRVGFLKRSFIPTGEASIGQENFQTGPYESMSEPTYTLKANINLYRGGRDGLEEKSRKAQRLATRVQTDQVIQTELFLARELFWNLVYLKEVKKLFEDALKDNKVNLAKANVRINAGLATKTDRLEFEISETILKQDLARVTVSIATTQRNFLAILGMPSETIIETIDRIPHDHNDTTSNLTMDFNLFRDVRLEYANKVDFEAQGEILKRWWTPSIDVYAESSLYTFRERDFYTQNDRIDNALGIKLSFNFDGFQGKFDGESLVAKARAAELNASQIKIESEAAFNSAKQELDLLHQLIHDGEKSVVKGAEYLKQTQDEYGRGVKNSPDVLSATIKQLEFKKRFAEIRRDYAIAKAQLQSLLSSENKDNL